MPPRSRSPILVFLVTALALAAGCAGPDDQAGDSEVEFDSLVSAAWLHEHLDDPDLVVLDATVIVETDASGNFRIVSGRSNYDAGHIPTAGFADLTGDLSDENSPFDFTAPSPEYFAAAMGALGVGNDSRVVVYDATNSVWAARVWWMLRWIGFDSAALLDGGLAAWTSAGGELSTEATTEPARTLNVNLRPGLIADQDEVRESIDDDGVHLVDALPEEHYRGEWAMYDQPGHIPGAVNVPSSSLLDQDGRFRADDDLAALFEVDRSERTITYCGGGIAASANAFALTRAGFTDVAVYDLSLEEWASNPDNPMDVVLEFDE